MRNADFTARIKKIEIVNRVLTGGWQQSIRVILEEIDLSDGNLLELKQFRPNEQVLVELSPVQVSLYDCGAGQEAVASAASTAAAGVTETAGSTATVVSMAAAGQENGREELAAPGTDDTAAFLSFSEGDRPLQANEQVIREWRFES